MRGVLRRVVAMHEGSAVRVAVRDERAGLPRVEQRRATALGGRGAGLVDMATRWGIDDHATDGKAVCSVVDLDGS